jgi:hypothetical protein
VASVPGRLHAEWRDHLRARQVALAPNSSGDFRPLPMATSAVAADWEWRIEATVINQTPNPGGEAHQTGTEDHDLRPFSIRPSANVSK